MALILLLSLQYYEIINLYGVMLPEIKQTSECIPPKDALPATGKMRSQSPLKTREHMLTTFITSNEQTPFEPTRLVNEKTGKMPLKCGQSQIILHFGWHFGSIKRNLS